MFRHRMTNEQAATATILATPRLPVGRLTELREFLDRLVAALASETHVSGGRSDETIQGEATQPLRHTKAIDSTAATTRQQGVSTARIPADRGSMGKNRQKGCRVARGRR